MAASTKAKGQSAAIPLLPRLWLKLYHATPKVSIGGLPVGFTLLWMSIFYMIRQFNEHYILVQMFDWPAGEKGTKEAAACLTGICHSSNLVPMLFVLLRAENPYNPSHHMKDHATWYQESATAMIQLCTGYMIYDGIVNILALRWVSGQGPVFGPDDWLYMGHHLATAFYMTSTRIYQAGHVSAMMCMFLGEFTNPTFNSYLVSQIAKNLACCSGPFAQKVIMVIEVACAINFLLFRVLIGPLTFIHMTSNLFRHKSARQHIPIFVRILWAMMIWGVVFGSIPWVYSFVDLLKLHLGGAEYTDVVADEPVQPFVDVDPADAASAEL